MTETETETVTETETEAETAELSLRNGAVALGGQPILQGVDVDLAAGEWLGVIGPNGAGKSTLLKALAGVVSVAGEVRVRGESLATLRPRLRAQRIALVPQVPLLPDGVAVLDYVLLGRAPHQGFGFAASRHDLDVVRAVLDRLDLAAFACRRVDTLSGGERQRVVVARVLAQETPIALLDEPTTALDLGHQIDLMELVDELRRERGLTVVTALHDLTLAGQFCDRLALLVDGAIVADGAPGDVLTQPTIEQHYGASVDILTESGAVVVVARRTQPS